MKQVEIKNFTDVYSQEQIDEIDAKIEASQKEHDAKLYDANLKAKDFPMNN